MGRRSTYKKARRINIILEAELHEIGKHKADYLGLAGGFSEYIARLIACDKKSKGRAVLAAKAA